MRFLPSQEWSTCVRELLGIFGIVVSALLADCRRPRRIVRRQMPKYAHTLPSATIPPAKYAPDSNSPGRPFLRRQESIQTFAAKGGVIKAAMPPCKRIDSCFRRNGLLVYGGLWGILANCGTRYCEIPAFAGMVLWGTGNRRRILALLLSALSPPLRRRLWRQMFAGFLLSQE